MAPGVNSQKDKRSRKGITLKIKQEIVEKSENGGRTSILANEYGLSRSTISTILFNKDKIKASKVSDASKRVIKGREKIVEMERQLSNWISDRQRQGEPISGRIICEKAKSIFDDLTPDRSAVSTTGSANKDFRASKGWLERFKHRSEVYSGVKNGDGGSSADTETSQVIKNSKCKVTAAKSPELGLTLKDFRQTHCNILKSIRVIVLAWKQMSLSCLNTAWRPLWPAIQQGCEDAVAVQQEIISLGESVGLKVDNQDDLQSLVKSENMPEPEPESAEEEDEEDARLKKCLSSWDTVKKCASLHPSIDETVLQICEFDDKVMSHFKNLLKEKRKPKSQQINRKRVKKQRLVPSSSTSKSENSSNVPSKS